jgi:hypothetical protein
VALALLAALIAVPALLSKSASPKPLASLPAASATPGAPGESATATPVVSVNQLPIRRRLNGTAHDPFQQQSGSGSNVASGSGSTSSSAQSALSRATGASSSARTNTGTGSSSSGGKSSSSTGSKSTGGTTPSTTTTPTPTPTPGPTPPTVSVLADNESYHVVLAMTNAAGGLNTLDPLERLSVLPSKAQPLMVELGVLKGGKRVMFALQPGAVVSGPGSCTPGPIDCEILSLAKDQIETLSQQTPGGGTAPVTMFAVTGIKVDKHSSTAAASSARQKVSQAGRQLLANSQLAALSLFQYRPSLGSVVNLQNLKVGGGT